MRPRARAVLAAIAVSATIAACGSPPSQTPLRSAAAPEWVQLPSPPLEHRAHTVGVWTGDELLVAGGDAFLCPPTADCIAPEDPPFASGAALDPETREWREIADAPFPFASASTAMVGRDAYFLVPTAASGHNRLLRYAVDDDSWHALTLPPAVGETGGWALVGAGDRLVAYLTTHEFGAAPDVSFDPQTGRWSDLPAPPTTPAFDRVLVAVGDALYLFDHELVPNPNSERPSLTRSARFDWRTGTWTQLADAAALYSGPWLVAGTDLVNPSLGSADGGEVNGWGRSYPYGSRLATTTGTWYELPPAPADELSAGAFTGAAALVFGTRGLVLDVERDQWIEMPEIPGDSHPTVSRNVFDAGAMVVTVGGERWADGMRGEVVEDAWMIQLGT